MARKGSGSSETVELLQKQFPKFSRVTYCMIKNPEYGVDYSAAAKRVLNKKKSKQPKKKEKKFTVRLGDAEYLRVQAALEKTGCKNYRELIEKMLQTVEE